jgi:signal transduction histidine kinase
MSRESLPCITAFIRVRADWREIRRDLAVAGQKPPMDPGTRAALVDALQAEKRDYEKFERSATEPTVMCERVRASLADLQAEASAFSDRVTRDEPFDASSLTSWMDRTATALEQIVSLLCARVREKDAQVDALVLRSVNSTLFWHRVCAFLTGILAVVSLGATRKRRRAIQCRIDELEAFSSRVAHDLRDRLTPVLLALARARTVVPHDHPYSSALARGQRSVHSLERIIQGLLTFAVSGARPESGATASVAEVVDDVVAEHQDEAATRRIELSMDCGCSDLAACSPGVLASIVGNLVANAIKYMADSAERRVLVRSRPDGSWERIEVFDTGPGVPMGAEKRIFDPYFRGHDGGTGIGLGLATVKRLTVAHGGRVELERREPHGSVFRVFLPRAARAGSA